MGLSIRHRLQLPPPGKRLPDTELPSKPACTAPQAAVLGAGMWQGSDPLAGTQAAHRRAPLCKDTSGCTGSLPHYHGVEGLPDVYLALSPQEAAPSGCSQPSCLRHRGAGWRSRCTPHHPAPGLLWQWVRETHSTSMHGAGGDLTQWDSHALAICSVPGTLSCWFFPMWFAGPGVGWPAGHSTQQIPFPRQASLALLVPFWKAGIRGVCPAQHVGHPWVMTVFGCFVAMN